MRVDWGATRVCVAGIRVVGRAAGEVLSGLGAEVTVVDDGTGELQQRHARELEALGVRVRLGDGSTLPRPVPDLLVVSPGFRPDAPLVRAAAAAGVPVWGDVELAWRLRPPGAAPWLCLTGTNGKTTTVQMLAEMLRAAGRRAVAAGNVGLPLLEAVLAREPYDVLAVELSSFQLHYTSSLRPLASAVLNLAADHLDWHAGMAAYAADKARVYAGTEDVCVYNVDDPRTEELLRGAAPRARAVGFTLGPPAAGQLGVEGAELLDRAFGPSEEAVSLASVSDVTPAAPHNVANALAAAALARAYGVAPAAVRAGLRAFSPDAHRIALVATVDGVDYVDDSKATNAHAAAASLRAFPSVVWVAGGLAKGAVFDELVVGTRDRLRGAVLLGQDRATIREALTRHAPEVPVLEVSAPDTVPGAGPGAGPGVGGERGSEVMDAAVRAAATLARPGDTVLLAPACASMDMYASYAARGEAFAAAVTRLARASAPALPGR